MTNPGVDYLENPFRKLSDEDKEAQKLYGDRNWVEPDDGTNIIEVNGVMCTHTHRGPVCYVQNVNGVYYDGECPSVTKRKERRW